MSADVRLWQGRRLHDHVPVHDDTRLRGALHDGPVRNDLANEVDKGMGEGCHRMFSCLRVDSRTIRTTRIAC